MKTSQKAIKGLCFKAVPSPRPPSSPDAVHVGLVIGLSMVPIAHGQLVIHHQGDRGHVDAPRQDIRGDEHLTKKADRIISYHIISPCMFPKLNLYVIYILYI